MEALVVPADPREPVRVIDLDQSGDRLANLQKEVGGWVDAVAHREGDLWINDEGRINGSPVNVRITYWELNDSALAKEGRAGEWNVVFGDCVVTGCPDREGNITAVDPALVDYFSALELSPMAVDDWTTRDITVIVTEWDLGDDKGYGLGL